jgi:hypothetical protein
MTFSGFLLLAGFIIFAALMVMRLLPTLLALPLMAAWIAFVAGMPFVSWLNDVLLGGALRLASPIALVIFGAMFARVIQKTGISDTIIKKAAELSGDQPISIAFLLTAATVFVFSGMSGLGPVIMIGSIILPIMTGVGISPIDAAVLFLLGINAGLMANIAGYGTYIGIFGSEAALQYYLPAVAVSVLVTCFYIVKNISGGDGNNTLCDAIKVILLGILSLPVSLLQALAGIFTSRPTALIRKKKELPGAALIAPVLPLAIIITLRLTTGFGLPLMNQVDPVAAALFGFIMASLYATLIVCPRKTVNVLAGAFVEGIQDIAGVLFLFVGIGMLVAAAIHPASVAILQPLIKSILPSSLNGLLLFFAVFAPAALYRGPLNMYGMGAGIAAILTGLKFVSPVALCGMFIAVGYLQGLADPTNSHNSWIGGYTGVDTDIILKKILPYAWAMCLLILAYVWLTQ